MIKGLRINLPRRKARPDGQSQQHGWLDSKAVRLGCLVHLNCVISIPMKRLQLFEFHDESWFPNLIREGQIEILSLANRLSGFADALAPVFSQFAAEAGAKTILDLCSGAGGPMVLLLEAMSRNKQPLPRLLLSDLYPNLAAWRAISETCPIQVNYIDHPVDATNVPAEVEADMVTIVNALHHFPMDMVSAIIKDATNRGTAFFMAEAFPRDFFRASAFLPALGLSMLKNPWLCERRGLAKALLSIPAPILTATGLWDWGVSAIRIHEPEELLPLAREIAPDYYWKFGSAAYRPWGRAVYLHGRAGKDPCSL